MESEMESMARSDVLRRFDEVRDLRVRSDYEDETYKHVLFPVYSTAYTYKGKQYHVLINGQSGRVEGDYPKSPAKLAAIVAGILLLLALLFWYSEGSHRRAETVPAYGAVYEEQQTASEQTENRMEEEELWDYSADRWPM
jgi:hypothetical protein